MKNRKIVYMGTTSFAAYILEALINAGYNVVGVVSQPDRCIGRKKILSLTPTKEVALKYKINVFAFENVNDNIEIFNEINPDLIITCAYGQKIGVDILNIPSYKAINVHASLLPLYRGGAPIHYAILNGDEYSGNTIMYMEEGLDTGAMLSKSKVKIDIEDTTSILFDKLMVDGALLLLDTLPKLFNNEIEAIEQDNAKASIAPNIPRSLELIDFNNDVYNVYNHIRGLLDIPGCYAMLDTLAIKLWKVSFVKEKHLFTPGYIKIDNNDYFKIACLNGFIYVYELQISGKKRTTFKVYKNNHKLELYEGAVLNETK